MSYRLACPRTVSGCAGRPRNQRVWFNTQLALPLLVLCLTIVWALPAVAVDYSWQEQHAVPSADGSDLTWSPEPFVYSPGSDIRYIDYENGSDANTGTSTSDPWKHHPWDANWAGAANAADGVDTYVFKGGVTYRGRLWTDDSGESGNPIRLTRDPNWGVGEARLVGSARYTGGWTQATAADVPADMPDPTNVWYRDDVDWKPKLIWEDGASNPQINSARLPNWTESNPLNPLDEWWSWTGRTDTGEDLFSRDIYAMEDTVNLTSSDPNSYIGATAMIQYGREMAYPYETEVLDYDAANSTVDLAISSSHKPKTGTKYYLHDHSSFLDTGAEFYYEDDSASPFHQRLFIRLPGDVNPNSTVVEIGKQREILEFVDSKHIEISGLTFAYTDHKNSNKYLSYQAATAIRGIGEIQSFTVRNCVFHDVAMAVYVKPRTEEGKMSSYANEWYKAPPYFEYTKDVLVADNDILRSGDSAIKIEVSFDQFVDENTSHGFLYSASVLRNRIENYGRNRASEGLYGQIPAIGIGYGQLVEVAGNVINNGYGPGIDTKGGKRSHGRKSDLRDIPLIRILVHHNKVTNSMLGSNDWGGIETWQGGNTYLYNNISANAMGTKHWSQGDPYDLWSGAQGQNYYLDGAYKTFVFNNIAWNDITDPDDLLRPFTLFKTVLGDLNMFVNNTARSAKQGFNGGGKRTRFIGNIFEDTSLTVLDANSNIDATDIPASAYYGNVSHDQIGDFGIAGAGGFATASEFANAMRTADAMAWETGLEATAPPLEDTYNYDFRPTSGSEPVNLSGKYFIPWSVYMTVGEWNFHRNAADPTQIIGENFFMSDEYLSRGSYYDVPDNDLTAVNVDAYDYVAGDLESWTHSALRFNGVDTYAQFTHADMTASYPLGVVYDETTGEIVEDGTYDGSKRRTVDMDTNSFMVEIYFQSAADLADRALVSKLGDAGYTLDIDANGKARMRLFNGGSAVATRVSSTSVNDGAWHHLVAEVDRAGSINLYVDGALDNGSFTGSMPATSTSLANTSDFYVGRDNAGRHFEGLVDFLRVSRGTLADSETTIDELHTWQFDGPATKDFLGNSIVDRRDAGAIELQNPADTAPKAVDGLGLTLTAESGVSVEWFSSLVGDLEGYNLYRSTIRGKNHALLNASPVSATTYLDTNVEAGRTYYYKVSAEDTGGNESAFLDELAIAVTDSNTLLAENFDDGDLTGWTDANGSDGWSINSSGELNTPIKRAPFLYWDDTSAFNWDTYSLNLRVLTTESKGEVGICFYYQDIDNNYVLTLKDGNNSWKLERVVGGNKTLLDSGTVVYDPAISYEVRVEVDPATGIVVLFDGTQLTSLDETVFVSGPQSGTIAFTGKWTNRAILDDVIIQEPLAAEPFSIVFDSTGINETDASYDSDSNSASLQSASWTRGAGLDPKTFSGLTDYFSSRNAGGATLSDAIASNDYYTVTLTPNQDLDFDEVVINLTQDQYNNSAQAVLMADVSGFNAGNELAAITVDGTDQIIDLSTVSALRGVTGPVEFRVYFWNLPFWGLARLGNVSFSGMTAGSGGTTVVAADDSDSVNEGSSVSIDVLANDTGATQIESFTQGSQGTVSLISGELVYEPDTGVWSGSDSFDYTAGDGSTSDSATVSVTISATNGTTPITDNAAFDELLLFGTGADGASRERSDGSLEIAAFGGDGIDTAGGVGDEIIFAKQDYSGDFQASVQVREITGPAGSYAGVMIRNGDGTQEMMALEASENGTLYLSQERTGTGAANAAVTSQISGVDVSHSEPEKWVMIEREGEQISFFTGADDGQGGIAFSEVDAGPVTLSGLSDPVQVGLFTISGDGTSNATAVFDNYLVEAVSTPEPFSIVFDSTGLDEDGASYASDSNSAALQSASWTRGSGLEAKTWGTSFQNTFNSIRANATSLADAIANDDYYTVTLTPNQALNFEETLITVGSQASGVSAAIMADVTGFTAGNELASLTVDMASETVDLSGVTALSGVNSPIDFRVYFWNGGNWSVVRLGNVTFSGQTQ